VHFDSVIPIKKLLLLCAKYIPANRHGKKITQFVIRKFYYGTIKLSLGNS